MFGHGNRFSFCDLAGIKKSVCLYIMKTERHTSSIPVNFKFLDIHYLLMQVISYLICLRYKENSIARSLSLQKQLQRYAPVSLNAEVIVFLAFLTSFFFCIICFILFLFSFKFI